MKKILLQIGFALCLLLTALSAKAAHHFLLRDFEVFLGVLLLGAGPALGMIAFRNELNEQRSWKILLCLGIWIVIVTLLCLSV